MQPTLLVQLWILSKARLLMIRVGNLNLILPTASYGLDLEHYNDLDSPNYTNTLGSVTTHKSLKCWYTNADFIQQI